MRSIHVALGQIAVWLSGLVGLWGVLMYRRDGVPRVFYWAVGLAIGVMLAQVSLGVAAMTAADLNPGDQHVFYGALIAVTFSLAYVYRAQFRRRPGPYYGLLLLFAMGLGIRGILTFGMGF